MFRMKIQIHFPRLPIDIFMPCQGLTSQGDQKGEKTLFPLPKNQILLGMIKVFFQNVRFDTLASPPHCNPYTVH